MADMRKFLLISDFWISKNKQNALQWHNFCSCPVIFEFIKFENRMKKLTIYQLFSNSCHYIP